MNEQYFEAEYREIFGDEGEMIPLTRRIWITWEDIRFQSPQNRGIWGISGPSEYRERLKGIWGGAGPGEIVAVLGEFRSGKSLLLNVISGDVKIRRGDLLSGRVLVNGFKRGQRWRRICAHVTQSHEELHGLLTIEEQLKFRAELALPAKWNENRRERVVNWVIKSLDLEKKQHVAVDDLTSGERKLLSIGLGLVGLPRVLLLDEPTQGLDPTRALEMMKTLRRLTYQRQMTTIITEKQLREVSISFIDRLLILGQGSTAYYGSFPEAKDYFETRLQVTIPEKGDNPLTCMLDAVNCMDCRRNPGHFQRIITEWEVYAFENQLYRANYPSVPFFNVDRFSWHRSWLKEFKEQFSRSFYLFIRNRTNWIGQTFLAMTLTLMIAFSAFQLENDTFSVRARFSVLFYTAVLFQFFPFILFLSVCYRDKWVLRRERRDSLARVSPAYLSGWFLIYGFRFLIVTLFSCIVYFIVGLRLPFNYALVFWLTLLAEAWVAMGMGYLIVTLVENVVIAETLASLILLVCIWYSGDFAYNPECTWILRWIAYLSPIFYSFNALVNNEFGGVGGKGEEFLKESGLNNFGVWPSIGTLLGFGLCYMIIGYFALSYSTRYNRNYI